MDKKQKKQLIILGVLLAIGVPLLLYLYVFKKDDTQVISKDALPGAGAQPAGKGQPATKGQPAGKGQPGAGAPAPAEQPEEHLEIPEVVRVRIPEYQWLYPEPMGGFRWTPPPGEPMVFDPLKVQNIDVVDPSRREELERMRREWRLTGLTRTWQEVDMRDAAGQPVRDADGRVVREWRWIWEVFFEGQRRSFRQNDRLPGTRFVVEEIFLTSGQEGAGVRLRGDTGAELRLELAPATRYAD